MIGINDQFVAILRYTKEDIVRLCMEDDCIVKWYLDASFGVHEVMKTHRGSIMTLEKGVVQAISMKQRIDTISSTEAELVLFNDIVSNVLWMRIFK
jgi:hypothetical protein